MVQTQCRFLGSVVFGTRFYSGCLSPFFVIRIGGEVLGIIFISTFTLTSLFQRSLLKTSSEVTDTCVTPLYLLRRVRRVLSPRIPLELHIVEVRPPSDLTWSELLELPEVYLPASVSRNDPIPFTPFLLPSLNLRPSNSRDPHFLGVGSLRLYNDLKVLGSFVSVDDPNAT